MGKFSIVVSGHRRWIKQFTGELIIAILKDPFNLSPPKHNSFESVEYKRYPIPGCGG